MSSDHGRQFIARNAHPRCQDANRGSCPYEYLSRLAYVRTREEPLRFLQIDDEWAKRVFQWHLAEAKQVAIKKLPRPVAKRSTVESLNGPNGYNGRRRKHKRRCALCIKRKRRCSCESDRHNVD